MARRKLSDYEKETRKYLLRRIDDFYHPDYEKREIISKEEYIKIILRDIKILLSNEVKNS